MTAWIVEALLASAALLALVLAIRLPVRRAFGPQVAYTLWALPALRLMLPAIPEGWTPVTPAPLAAAGEQVAMFVLTAPAPGSTPPLLGVVLFGLWSTGAIVLLGWQAVAHRRFVRRVTASEVPFGQVGRVTLVVSDHIAAPLAYGVARPVVAVPADFGARYDAPERELALAHELAHHRRGDMVANWAALAVLALHWFNPLAWIAFRAFRIDQEMANDAHVLGRSEPYVRYTYGCALAKAAGVARLPTPAAACGLHTITDLKGRLRMLANTTSRRRRIAGAATVTGVTLAFLGLTASGGSAAGSVRATVENATGVPLASLSPSALLQDTPDAPQPPAPSGPTAPGSGGRHIETVRTPKAVHVTVTENGQTRHYAGAEAEAWLTANPQPSPPAPPIPPVPGTAPVPPAPSAPPGPSAQPRTIVVRPGAEGRPTLIVSRRSVPAGAALPAGIMLPRDFDLPADCGAAGKTPPPGMVIKGEGGDRSYTVLCTRAGGTSTAGIEHDAYAQALASLRTTRRSVESQKASSAFPEQERRHALAAIDTSIAELEANLAQTR